MFTVFFDRTLSVPLYEQLFRHIRDMIQSGTLADGAKLPSKRDLSAHLRISPTTVDMAYQQLVAEGYLRSVPKSGFYVEKYVQPVYTAKQTEPIDAIPDDAYEFNFRTNVVDASAFPLADWLKHEKRVVAELPREIINQSSPQGLLSLRIEIANYLFAMRGIKTTPDRIIVGAGSEYLLQLLVLITGKNIKVAVENPGYGKLAKLYEALQIPVCHVELDESGLSLEGLLKTNVSLVHVSPSHQFPSGLVMSVSRRIQLLNWANEAMNRHVIEDDYDSEFRFSGTPIPAMKSLDIADKVIYLNSFTKSMAPTFRMSYMVLPKSLLEKYLHDFAFLSSTVPIFNQAVMADYMADGSFERHMNRMRILYRNKRDCFLSALKASNIGSKIAISGEEAGLHFLIEFPAGIREDELIASAKIHGVKATGMNDYRMVNDVVNERAVMIVGYSGLAEDQIPDIVMRLNDAWRPLLDTK